MGKRSTGFKRRERDYYSTPEEAVIPLLPHLPAGATFAEPCAGDGRLARHLEKRGFPCVFMFDIEPQHADVDRLDVFSPAASAVLRDDDVDLIITNPPWRRDVFHPMLEIFRVTKPTWLLHDANWLFTRQAAPHLPYIHKIVTIGRVTWIEGTNMSGKDDAVWSLHKADTGVTEFYGRAR